MLGFLREFFEAKPLANGYREGITPQLSAAVILLEAAQADDEFDANERISIIGVLGKRFGLSEAEARQLMEEAEAARKQSSDLWRFTRTLNEKCSPENKRALIEEVWRIVYADGLLHGREDYLMHKLMELLNLTHQELIAAKMRVLEDIRG